MNILKTWYVFFLIVVAFTCLPFATIAQNDTLKRNDTIKKRSFNEYLISRKGIFGKIVKTIMTDTVDYEAETALQRNDVRFQKYSGTIIRHIIISRLNFGVPINDTLKEISTPLTRISNKLHKKTRERIIKNNLFFKENDSIQPYLLADNERYLRDLPYIQDAKISVVRLQDDPDSVDIIVRTKDVLSIGAEVSSVDPKNTALSFSEENIGGTGNKISIKSLFDKSREQKFGYGSEFIWRNISGTFIDGYAGYQNFNNTIYGNKEENAYYARLIRPLANSYLRWTYSLEASRHQTKNMYSGDSLYFSDYRYSYNSYDAWAGFNVDASFLDKYVRGQRLRALLALRLLSQKFDALPKVFTTVYNPSYADISGALASVSIFAQDFYKTQYIYGFGRNEDIPEGIDMRLTAGYTIKQNQNRPYIGLKFERNYFTSKKRYLDFIVRVEGSLYKKHFEDITALGNVDFFNRLQTLGRWKQRTFLSAGITWQINKVFNYPLFLESTYGLPELRSGNLAGYIRATVKGESVFYSPLVIASFRFAPFVFYDASLFTPDHTRFAESKVYTSVGGGIRSRNESLTFGTFELKGYYFPAKNFYHQSFRIDFNTNLKFKYNSQFSGRPDFIQVN